MVDDSNSEEERLGWPMDPDFDYDEALAELKDLPFDKACLLLLNPVMERLLAAWPHIRHIVVHVEGGDKSLHIAWHYAEHNVCEWAMLAGVNEADAWGLLNFMAKTRMIYPDGTRHPDVSAYLQWRADVISGVGNDR